MSVEEFISKAKQVHGSKYDYSKVEYINNKTKVCIICPIHGEFTQTPHNHISQKQGCPVCGKEYVTTWQKYKYDDFIQHSKEKFGDKYSFPYIDTEYENNHSKITIMCNECGEIFTKHAGDHLQSKIGGCRYCLKHSKIKQYSYIDLKTITDKNDIELSQFNGLLTNKDSVECVCKKHGKYRTLVSTILDSRGFCKKCNSKPIEWGIIEKRILSKYNNELEIIGHSNYDNIMSKITLKCKKCGYVFDRIVTNLLSTNFNDVCPKCSNDKISKERTKTNEHFINECMQLYGNLYDYSETIYIASNKKVKIKCNQCGKYFEITPNSFLQGHGCPYHNHVTSVMENEIKELLIGNNILFEEQKRFDWLGRKSLDFYLPDYNIAIECQGEQHFKESSFGSNKSKECLLENLKRIQINDNDKLKECKEHGIKILYYANYNFDFPYEVYRDKNKLLNNIKL